MLIDLCGWGEDSATFAPLLATYGAHLSAFAAVGLNDFINSFVTLHFFNQTHAAFRDVVNKALEGRWGTRRREEPGGGGGAAGKMCGRGGGGAGGGKWGETVRRSGDAPHSDPGGVASRGRGLQLAADVIGRDDTFAH